MYTHYAPMVSYYSAKTRACLGYKRIPFVEVYEPAAYRDRIAPAVGRTVFPVLEATGARSSRTRPSSSMRSRRGTPSGRSFRGIPC